MDGLDKIKERILRDARDEAEKASNEAEDKARNIKEAKADEAEKLKRRLTEENTSMAAENKRRMIAAAELEMRKQLLSVKRGMLEQAFKNAVETIKSLPDQEYKNIIKNMLLRQKLQGEAEVIFSALDKERLDNGFLTAINAQLASDDRGFTLKNSKESGAFEGGFILKSGDMEFNSSFEAVIRMIRDDAEPQVAGILFKEA